MARDLKKKNRQRERERVKSPSLTTFPTVPLRYILFLQTDGGDGEKFNAFFSFSPRERESERKREKEKENTRRGRSRGLPLRENLDLGRE